MTPTAEQAAIITTGRESPRSMIIQAYAGCAKTSTLCMMAAGMKKTSALAVAFNTKIASELKERLPEHFEVKTLNSLGNAAWNSAIGKRCEVDRDKIYNLLKARGLDEDTWHVVRALVTKARHVGLVPRGSQGVATVEDTPQNWRDLTDYEVSDEHIAIAREVLKKSVAMSYEGIIDFDDQIYMSAQFGGIFKRYKLVMVDESQDLSPLNIRQIKRCAEDRIIAVGDRFQSIYGFRGADINAMDNLKTLRPEWDEFTLSETFRCPRAVVRRRNHFLPAFRAAAGNPEGHVHDIQGQWFWHNVPKEGSTAILCRNNAPLVAMSFKLLALRIPFYFLGRDTSRTIIALAKKILPRNGGTSEQLCQAVSAWLAAEVASAEAAGKVSRLDSLHDRAEAIIAVINAQSATSIADVARGVNEIYSKDKGVILATAHKAKGLEWDNVVHLDPFRCPSRWAELGSSEYQQELNILNTLETRARHTLLTASLSNFAGK